MITIKKILNWQRYQTSDGREYYHTGGKVWAVVNEQDQVMLSGKSNVHMYTLKYIAQYEADSQNRI